MQSTYCHYCNFCNECIYCQFDNYNGVIYSTPFNMPVYDYYYTYANYQINPYFYYAMWLNRIGLPKIKLPKISLPKIDVPKINAPKISLPKIDVPEINAPKINLPNAPNWKKKPNVPKGPNWPNIPHIDKFDPGINIPTAPYVKEMMKNWKQKSEEFGGKFIEEGSEFWEQAKQEAKNASTTLERIKRRFTPCQPRPGYACIEVILISDLPIFGYQVSQDVTLRICYPPNIKIEEKFKQILIDTIKECTKAAMKEAEKVFMAAIILSSFGALVGSLTGALLEAIQTFSRSFLDCMTSDIKIGNDEVTPSIYLRDHTYYPSWSGSPCKYMFDEK